MIAEQQQRMKERILTGKICKMTNEERDKLKQEKLQERFKFESTRMRGYELIYPSSDPEKNAMYDKMITKANDIWDEFTTGKRHKQRHDQQRPKVPEKQVTKKPSVISPVIASAKAQTHVHSTSKEQMTRVASRGKSA